MTDTAATLGQCQSFGEFCCTVEVFILKRFTNDTLSSKMLQNTSDQGTFSAARTSKFGHGLRGICTLSKLPKQLQVIGNGQTKVQ